MIDESASGVTTPSGAAAPSVLWKAFDVLNAFSHRHRVLTLAQVVRISGLSKSTAHRVLSMLVDLGAVEQTREGYRIGLRMFSLGALPPEAALREAALVHLEELHRFTGQTLHFAILRDADVVYLEKLPSRRSVSTPATVGDRLPANCTAVGKALLAFSDEKSTAYALDGPLRRRTAHSLTTPDEIRRQLASVKAAGHATDREETAPGLACVAVPVLVGDRAVAALSVAFQSSAGSGEVLLNPLRQAATAISKAPAMRDFAASALTATTG